MGSHQAKHPNLSEMIEAIQRCTTVGTSRQSGNAEISREDEVDALCVLRTTSVVAWRTVTLVAETTPQHVLQNEVMS